MRNKIALINFPSELDIDYEVYNYYKLFYFDEFPSDFILTQFQAILLFDPKDQYRTENINYYRTITKLNLNDYIKLKKDTLLYLDERVGRVCLVNPRQFEILPGSVVRSKVHRRLGVGLVKKIINKTNVEVNFINAKNGIYQT
ncbi:hypothetical protein HBN50_12945 [Halobacteriovorax sp. GB3]|uniref:hypothetical protein n=1 Tax=Halobacteriovorax sp. GB3 TaxID=2719615 RepID=UPI002360D863|nr:hypothetical protein [Halobacteriovorax sp. GB3]MDD0854012.1 hypothetical protein [Halobacteriovorax sp. GB3]